MIRRILAPTGVLLGLLLAVSAGAAPATTAELFPADTFLYVEGDADALMKGIRQLDLARLIEDPEVRECLRPALEKIGANPEKPVESLLAMLPVKAWVDGHFAVGLRGVHVTTERPDGTKVRTRIGPNHPISARLFHELAGMAVVSKLAQEFGGERKPMKLSIQPDLVATLEPGPQLKALVEGQMDSLPPGVVHERLEIAGRQVSRFAWEERVDRDVVMPFQVYADMSGDTWILATDADTFATALKGGPEKSLATSKRFQRVRDRLTGDGRVLLAYVDVAQALGMISTAVSPIVKEELEILGLSSFQGFGAAVTMTNGGVRETYALVFDGRPRGIFKLLDAMPGGLGTAGIAPGSTVGYVAFKLDLALLVERARELTAELVPGVESFLDPVLAHASRQIGIDIVGDLLPALGDEVGVLVFPPQGAMIPQGIMLAKIRDVERFEKVLEVAKRHVGQTGMELRSLKLTDGGSEGFWLHSQGLPVQPSFAVRNGYLVGAMGPAQLRSFLRQWGKDAEAGKALANDEVYQKVLAGLGAGKGERLAMLTYVNLRTAIPPALGLGLPFLGMVDGIDDWIDIGAIPEPLTVGKYFSGIGIAIQRDGNALTLDTFSPTGSSAISAVAGWIAYQRMEENRARWMRDIEETEREIEDMRRQMAEAERAQMADQAFIGFFIDQEGSTGGVLIQDVIQGAPAQTSGLQAGDLIVKVGDQAVASFAEFREQMADRKPGQKITLGVKRGEQMLTIELTLARRGDFND